MVKSGGVLPKQLIAGILNVDIKEFQIFSVKPPFVALTDEVDGRARRSPL
jgi:hypothetical protein